MRKKGIQIHKKTMPFRVVYAWLLSLFCVSLALSTLAHSATHDLAGTLQTLVCQQSVDFNLCFPG
jgi:hypothetical protein